MGSISIVGGPTAVSAPGSMSIAMPDGSTPSVSVNGGAYSALGGGTFLEYYTSLTAGTGAQTSLTLSGLNGDVDGDYMIDIEMRSAQAANSLAIQLNGAATNLDWMSSNNLVGGAVRTDWALAQAGVSPILWAVGDFVNIQGRIRARSGRIRIMNAMAYSQKGGATTGFSLSGRYNDTATNLTSISIVAGIASGLAIGSYIRMVRMWTTNPLA
jgi:hypothetical protein